jgi:hypothetical protein
VHALVHPASTDVSLASTEISGGCGNPPQVVWHWHVHVDGQSESTVQGVVCCATHVFQVT